ncbi:MAG: energy transducer TonB [Acidobacteria bacterium]|nr:energy transducer TonB [Acidobacteriota bacterium]
MRLLKRRSQPASVFLWLHFSFLYAGLSAFTPGCHLTSASPGFPVALRRLQTRIEKIRYRRRLAMVGVTSGAGSLTTALAESIETTVSTDAIEVLEADLVDSALTGVNWKELLNMNREDAARIGALLGADLFLLFTGEVRESRDAENRLSHLAWYAALLVDGTSGALLQSDFFHSRAESGEAARERLLRRSRDLLRDCRATATGSLRDAEAEMESLAEAGRSKEAREIRDPVVLSHVKPEFSREADLAGIEATVDLEVEFKSDGTIGQIRLNRWAGFGLDEAAMAAARKLRFTPAMVRGVPVTTWQRLVYNFRRMES